MARTGRPRVHKLNTAAFSDITEQTLYWAGFLMADGCVTDRGDLKLTLAVRDRPHLERFANFLESSHPISEDTRTSPMGITSTCCTLNISSKQLVHDLLKFGVTPRKSLVGTATTLAATSRHFWRGVIDGDGCVGTYPVREYTQLKLGLTGGRGLCNQFLQFCLDISPEIRSEVRQTLSRASSIVIHDRHARSVLEELYRGATICLLRKLEKFNAAV